MFADKWYEKRQTLVSGMEKHFIEINTREVREALDRFNDNCFLGNYTVGNKPKEKISCVINYLFERGFMVKVYSYSTSDRTLNQLFCRWKHPSEYKWYDQFFGWKVPTQK